MNTLDKYKIFKIDCENCCGLCCTALFCSKEDGFPATKQAGMPCRELESNFRCKIHSKLVDQNRKGCLRYDCFGAGQIVTQNLYQKKTWKDNTVNKNEMFEVYLKVYHLQEMKYYLLESLSLLKEREKEIEMYIKVIDALISKSVSSILHYDMKCLHEQVNEILRMVIRKKTISSQKDQKKGYLKNNSQGRNLYAHDFSMSLLMACNLSNCDLHDCCFLGADMRDCNIRNADLSNSFFLTQGQINACIGNANTKLPKHLTRPKHWL